MNAFKCILVILLALATPAWARADTHKPPTKSRATADLVVIGKVHDLSVTWHDYGTEGTYFRCLAEVIVTTVERGRGPMIGERINIRWTVVVRRSAREHEDVISGTFYRIKADDIVRFWLMRDGKDWKIIDHPDGVENVTFR